MIQPQFTMLMQGRILLGAIIGQASPVVTLGHVGEQLSCDLNARTP